MFRTDCVAGCALIMWRVYRVLICPVIEEDRSSKKQSFKVDGKVSCMKYLDSRMYVGLKSGTLLVYSCDKGLSSTAHCL